MREGNYTVYKHVNKINGKVYIGLTSWDVRIRWHYGHGYKGSPHFIAAINKYGWNNFDHVIVREGLSKEEACILERKLIKRYNSRDPLYGYNISCGGESGGKGRKQSEEERQMRREKSMLAWSDPKLREEQSKRLKGLKRSEETRRKISEARKGCACSEEQKEQISSSLKKYFADPKNRKRASDAVKTKIPVICLDTGEVFDSSSEAGRKTGVQQANISSCCRGVRKKAGGFHWAFYENSVAC